MRVEQLTRALHEASAAQAPVDGALDDVVGRHRRRRRRVVGGVAGAVMVVVALIVGTVTRGGDGDDSVIADQAAGAAVAGEWEQIPDPPLSPRSNTTMVWTDDEVLVVGGDQFTCPPGADCGYEGPTFADGAAFDPDTRTWRPIADAPIEIAYASTAVVGDDVYLWVPRDRSPEDQPAFLRYSIADDTWRELEKPPGGERWYSLVATDTRIVAVVGSQEAGRGADMVFDVERGSWSELPVDPLAPSFDRWMVPVGPHLYLFATALDANPGAHGPGLSEVARLDPTTGHWEELPPTESIGVEWIAGAFGHAAVDGPRIINPVLGSSDGGETDPYDHPYPYGGIYDTAVPEWRPLPQAPNDADTSLGAIGADRVWPYGEVGAGVMLDTVTNTWIEVPGLATSSERRNVVGTDRSIVAVGGERWSSTDGGLLGDAWMLTFERP